MTLANSSGVLVTTSKPLSSSASRALGRRDRRDQLGIHARNQRSRHLRRTEKTHPGLRHRIARQAFSDGRNVRPAARALVLDHADDLDGAAVDERHRGRERGEQDRNLPGQEIRHGRAAAPIGHVDPVDAGVALEILAGDVMNGVRSGASERELARMGLRIGDQFRDVAHRQGLVHHEAHGQLDRERERGQVGDEVGRKVLRQHRRDVQGGRRAEQQRGAVRLRPRDRDGRQGAAAARPVVDDDRQPGGDGKRIAHRMADDVGRAAGRQRRSRS